MFVPYKEYKDRDTTIIWTNEVLKDDFSIWLFADEKGYDVFGFYLLTNDEWELLEKEFGKSILSKYLFNITLDSKIFSWRYDMVEYLLKKENDKLEFV